MQESYLLLSKKNKCKIANSFGGLSNGIFSFFVDIDGRNGLIVGGGKIALHKLQKLLPYEPVLKIVAPEISVDMKQTALENNICVIERLFERSDLTQMYFVIAASDNADVNAEIGKLCREQKYSCQCSR